MDVLQYSIMSYSMCNTTTDGQLFLHIKFILRRRLTGFLLTSCLPTLLTMTIGHLTNHFDQSHFPAAIGVNLTLLLVLTTM